MEPTETGKAELIICNDPRLLAGVSAAVNHFAEAAGLGEAARVDLTAAFEDALHAAFQSSSQAGEPIQLTISSPGGRIDAVLNLHGTAADAGRAEAIRKLLSGKVDIVTLDKEGGAIRLHVVKCPSPSPKKR